MRAQKAGRAGIEMRIHKGDILWLVILGLAVLSFLNIFVSLNSRHFPVIDKAAYFPSQSSKGNQPLNLPSRNINSAGEGKDSAPLPLELRGTIIGSPSLAFIYNSDTDKYAVYKLNDLIAGYKILDIRPAKVILGKSGAARELLLAGRIRAYAPDEQAVIFADAGGTKLISRVGIINLIPQANELLRKVKILPVPGNVSDGLLGFRLENVPSGSIIEEAGIKSGDIIHSVEGRRLESVQDAMQALGVIRKQSGFEVVLLRQDKPIVLRYEFRN